MELVKFMGDDPGESLITAGDAKRAVARNLILGLAAVSQPMNADQGWISGIETAHVPGGPILAPFKSGTGKAAAKEIEKRFVGRGVVQCLEDLAGFGEEEVAGLKSTADRAPVVATNFAGLEPALVQWFENLGSQAMNKFGSELDRVVKPGIVSGEDSPANAVARF